MSLLPYLQMQDQNLTLLQGRWIPILNALLKAPLPAGMQIDSIPLVTGLNVINHKLQQKLQGYVVVLKSANVDLYDQQLTNQTPDTTLQLVSSGPATISLWVY